MVAYMFVLLGVVRERIALTVVFLDIILYAVGGVIGTMHHLYFSGEPAEHLRHQPRPLAMPGGRTPLATRVRPRAAARPLPRTTTRLQQLPVQVALHPLRL